MAFLMQ